MNFLKSKFPYYVFALIISIIIHILIDIIIAMQHYEGAQLLLFLLGNAMYLLGLFFGLIVLSIQISQSKKVVEIDKKHIHQLPGK